jgi:oxalate decarboxylase/phosphoglucose isomerase-like protein (cupin superfamily)
MPGIQFEVIERDGVRYAEIIWAASTTEKTKFCSPDNGSMQFGLLAHEAGFVEAAHYHKPVERKIPNLVQMFVVQKGKIAVDFFTPEGEKFREVVVGVGDAILLVDGAHSIRVLEDMQCVSVKQGPFLGVENDKIEIRVKP